MVREGGVTDLLGHSYTVPNNAHDNTVLSKHAIHDYTNHYNYGLNAPTAPTAPPLILEIIKTR